MTVSVVPLSQLIEHRRDSFASWSTATIIISLFLSFGVKLLHFLLSSCLNSPMLALPVLFPFIYCNFDIFFPRNLMTGRQRIVPLPCCSSYQFSSSPHRHSRTLGLSYLSVPTRPFDRFLWLLHLEGNDSNDLGFFLVVNLQAQC